jgi:hypothetical protein
MTNSAMDARARRLLVSQAPLDQVPASAFLPALAGVLGPGLVLSQRLSPDISSPAAAAAARAIAAAPPGDRWRWPATEADTWSVRLAAMVPALGDDPALYFSVRWGTLGALRAAPGMVLTHALALAGQSLGCLLTSLTGEEGLRLDFVDHAPAVPAGAAFELIVWGVRWARAVRDALEQTPTR